MEKVRIVSCVNTGRMSKKNEAIYEVIVDYPNEIEHRKCASFGDDFSLQVDKEVEAMLKPASVYQGVQQYYISLPKAGGAMASKFPPKDWAYDKKKTAITVAGNIAAFNKQTVEQAITGANEILTWLKAE